MDVPSTEGRPREASQGWGGTGTRGCGSQLHPRADPGATPPATKGWPWSGHRGTRKREKPVARWTGAFLLPASALARHTPSRLGEGIKRRANPKPDQSWGRRSLARPWVPAFAGTNGEMSYDRDHRAASVLAGKTPMPLLKFGVGQPVTRKED